MKTKGTKMTRRILDADSVGLSQFSNSFPPSPYGFSSPYSPRFIRNDSFASQAAPAAILLRKSQLKAIGGPQATRTLLICDQEHAVFKKSEKILDEEALTFGRVSSTNFKTFARSTDLSASRTRPSTAESEMERPIRKIQRYQG